jgi:hypothetical protein
MGSMNFWTLQKRTYAFATTIIAVGAILGIFIAKSSKINDSINSRIDCRAERVADYRDSIQKERRYPLDSAILARLEGIRVDVRRTTYFQEEDMSKASYARARAEWVRDSLKFLTDKPIQLKDR